jgi:hypothetical protein
VEHEHTQTETARIIVQEAGAKQITLSFAGLAVAATLCLSAAEQPTSYAPPPTDLQAAVRAVMLQPQPAVELAPKLERFGV